MDFETFKEELANSVKERLDSRGGEEYSVTLNKVDKANETYDAVTVKPENGNIGVNISATKAFEEYENGKDFDSIAAQVADFASRAIEGRPDFDLSSTLEVQARSSWSLQNKDVANRFYPIGLFRVLQALLICNCNCCCALGIGCVFVL